ncbi:MAG: protein translocase subunit SecD [Anaerolineae bacterium]|nr:protein translocase subunit SecD [Anaerolineae bacterium]
MSMQTHYRWLAFIVVVVLATGWMMLPDAYIRIDANGDGDYADPELGDYKNEIEFRLGLDLQGGIRVLLSADVPPDFELLQADMEASMQVIERRVDALGVTEPVVQLSGSNRIIVELPGISDPETAVATIRETGLLEFVDFGGAPLAVGTIIQTDTPKGGAEVEPTDATAQIYHTVMTGANLADAYPIAPNTTAGQRAWSVGMKFKPEGRTIFAQHTAANVGRYLGIVLDGAVISSPSIHEAIDSESSMITGDFTYEEAYQLAIQLRYGALAVPLKVESIEAIGPTLGAVSVDQSVKAGLIGIITVFIFMLVYYRVPGLAASLALGVFTLINLALYRFIPVTLTLPAITGFLIGVGTAVDGNILIFERFKEELRAGRSLQAAFRFGFDRAFPAIRDSNISTILICLILYWFGSQFGASAVRGFAVTLAMGLVINLFTAIIVTRTFLALFINFGREQLEARSWLLGV